MPKKPSPVIPIKQLLLDNPLTVTTTVEPDVDFYILPADRDVQIIDNTYYFNLDKFQIDQSNYIEVSKIVLPTSINCNRYKIFLSGVDIDRFAIINNTLFFNQLDLDYKTYNVKVILSSFDKKKKIEKNFNVNVTICGVTTTTTTSTTTLSPEFYCVELITTTTTTTTTTPEPSIYDNLYIMILIDEAEPNYTKCLDGKVFGNLWPVDSAYLSNVLESSQFNTNQLAIFDMDSSFAGTESDSLAIWPSGAILNNNITFSPCKLPIPISQIIRTPRYINSANSRSLFNFVLDNIFNPNSLNWGTSFEKLRFNKPDATFVIVVDDSGSMNYNMVKDAITELYASIVFSNLKCIVLTSCGSERWMQWISYIIENLNNLVSIYNSNPLVFPITNINFCDGCSNVDIQSLIPNSNPNQYKARLKLKLQNRYGIGTVNENDLITEWNINNAFTENEITSSKYISSSSFSEIANWIEIDTSQNMHYKQINVYLACRKNAFLLNITSFCSLTSQIYEWNNIEVNINSQGLPDGIVKLETPSRYIGSISDFNESNISYYHIDYNGSQDCSLIPDIEFEYIDTINLVYNECSEFDLLCEESTTTTTTTTTTTSTTTTTTTTTTTSTTTPEPTTTTTTTTTSPPESLKCIVQYYITTLEDDGETWFWEGPQEECYDIDNCNDFIEILGIECGYGQGLPPQNAIPNSFWISQSRCDTSCNFNNFPTLTTTTTTPQP